MRNALLLFKKPVGWISGGATWGKGRAWGKKVNPQTLVNLFDGPESWVLETGWVDNGDGSFTNTDGTSNRRLYKDLGTKVTEGNTYTIMFDIDVFDTSGTVVRGIVKFAGGGTTDQVGEYQDAIVAGSGVQTGLQSFAGGLTNLTVSNIRCYSGDVTNANAIAPLTY